MRFSQSKKLFLLYFLCILFLVFSNHARANSDYIDLQTLAAMNHDAETLWNEIMQSGVSAESYLHAKKLGNDSQDKYLSKKIHELKYNVFLYVQSSPFEYQRAIPLIEENLKGSIVSPKNIIPIHPFLQQLFLENLVMEFSRGWVKEQSSEDFYENYTLVTCYKYPEKFNCSIPYKNLQKRKVVETFVKNVLYIALFQMNKRPYIGLSMDWSVAAMSVLNNDFFNRMDNWLGAIMIRLTPSNVFMASNSKELENFAEYYNSMQEKYWNEN